MLPECPTPVQTMFQAIAQSGLTLQQTVSQTPKALVAVAAAVIPKKDAVLLLQL